ncbi:MAG: helicase-exonuclease AddAB subunit AddA [Oscillospiraceae bacterium]|nr:helicase-exonuclease AddAB subunit AddA [Oscillospiraceae bacterium]
MGSNWTKEQLDAITARGTGVIVSAAAGSGKTSVLVERLLGILSDSENKIPADRLVVVTFTNDAAEQMKQRLSAALSEKIEREPDNLWLCRQQALLRTAKISTIHSFCFDLIRENIQSLDVSAGFRILDDTEEKILMRRAMEDTFEQFYGEQPESTEQLCDFFSGSRRGDTELEETALSIYEFLISIPYYGDWIESKIAYYGAEFSPENAPLAAAYLARLSAVYERLLSQAEYAQGLYIRLCGKSSDAIEAEADRIRLMIKNLSCSGYDWDTRVVQPEPPKTRISFPRGMTDEEKSVSEKIKKVREKYKDGLDKTAASIFKFEEICADYKKHAEILSGIYDIIRCFSDRLSKLKAEKNALGFSDAEQLAIRLLTVKDESGEIRRTRLAAELSEYYSVIMIDEFQDANNNQDLIFKMLSKGGTAEKGGTNLFTVGDVKQSIYRFRLANPKLFLDALDKSEQYTGTDFSGTNAAILLNRNFRSSGDVIGFVNFVFENLMSRTAGEVDYTESEKLVQGLSYPSGDRTTEILVVPSADAQESDEGIFNEEARAAAMKIKSMLGVKTVYDRGAERPCEPRDFCILLRSNKQAETYVDELAAVGIRACAEEPEGYLESREISVLTNLLAVIDNPMQNIPLVSVLMSPMFMLTAEDTAQLAVAAKEQGEDKLFKAVKLILDGGTDIAPDTALYTKLERFMQMFEKLRYCAASQRLERFIRTIYDSTDFLSAVQVYEDGSRKRANLRLLLDVAESYEKNSGGGLSGFVRYIDMIIRRNGDFRRASVTSANDNAVAVKTIHKSKGLEYPFVFLCGTSKRFNEEDLKRRMQINSEYGVGFRIQEREKLKLYNSFPQDVIKEINRAEAKSEEMRLLYVALTRAREQLFITIPDSEKTRRVIDSVRSDIMASGGITPDIAAGAGSMLEWIAMAMLVHPDGEWFRDGEFLPVKESGAKVRVVKAAVSQAEEATAEDTESALPDEDKVRRLKEVFGFDYDDELTKKSAKITVTEISKSGDDEKLYLRRPDFVTERGALTAAEKGTAMHTFMQYADYAAAEADPRAEAERLAEYGLISPEERDSLDIPKLEEFFRSDLYMRIRKSDDVRREQKFLIKKSHAALDDERLMEYNDNSMLQGIADCMFDEDSELVLVDYKTDRNVSEKVLAARYDLQLKLYAAALGRIFGKRVKEAYLYSFSLGKAIKVI